MGGTGATSVEWQWGALSFCHLQTCEDSQARKGATWHHYHYYNSQGSWQTKHCYWSHTPTSKLGSLELFKTHWTYLGAWQWRLFTASLTVGATLNILSKTEMSWVNLSRKIICQNLNRNNFQCIRTLSIICLSYLQNKTLCMNKQINARETKQKVMWPILSPKYAETNKKVSITSVSWWINPATWQWHQGKQSASGRMM